MRRSDVAALTTSPYEHLSLALATESADGASVHFVPDATWTGASAFFAAAQGQWALVTLAVDSAAGGTGAALYRGAVSMGTSAGATFAVAAGSTGALWLGKTGMAAAMKNLDMVVASVQIYNSKLSALQVGWMAAGVPAPVGQYIRNVADNTLCISMTPTATCTSQVRAVCPPGAGR